MNICFITSTRADYGLLKPLINTIKKSDKYTYSLIATGAHLSPKFGNTYLEIEEDFNIDKKIEINIDSDSNTSICKTMGLCQILMSDALNEINNKDKIKLVVLLGDRFEILAVSQVCLILGLKTCHLAGGDITLGALDDKFRNAITQLSTYHFPTCEESKNNLIKMNILESKIKILGNPGLEIFLDYKPVLSKEEIKKRFNINDYILIVFHPETNNKNTEYINHFFNGISKSKFQKVIIQSNCDPGYQEILKNYKKNYTLINNLKRDEYLSLAYHSKYYVGNSSSGIYELPYLNVPIINVGDRQKGRKISGNIRETTFEDLENKITSLEDNINVNNLNCINNYKIYKSKKIFINFLDNI